MQTKKLQKGDLVQLQHYGLRKSIFMVIEHLENDNYFLIRVKRKDGRFDIRYNLNMYLNNKKHLNYILIDNNDFLLDKRDLNIFNDFQEYISNNHFKTFFKSNEITYLIDKKRWSYINYFDIKINNLNLSKYKKYSNKV